MLLLQGQQSHHTSPPGQQQHTQESRNWRVSSAASLSSGTLSHGGDSMGNGLNLMGEVPLDEQPSRILYVSGIAAEVSDEELCRLFEVCWGCSRCLVGAWGGLCWQSSCKLVRPAGRQPRSRWCCEWKGSCGPGAVLAWPVGVVDRWQLQLCDCCRQDGTCCVAGPMLGLYLLWVEHGSSASDCLVAADASPAPGACLWSAQARTGLKTHAALPGLLMGLRKGFPLVSDSALGPQGAIPADSLLAATYRSPLAPGHLPMLTCRSMERSAPCTRPASPRVTWS